MGIYMKVLMICGVFPPMISATAVLIDKLLPFFEHSDVVVDGLTVKKNFSEKKYIYRASKVYRANTVLNTPVGISGIGDFVYKVRNRIKRKFFKKSNNSYFKKEVVNGLVSALKKIRTEEYDCIIAVCAYYDAAVALLEYKEKYGLNVPIALYQVDPLAENCIYKKNSNLQKHLRDVILY